MNKIRVLILILITGWLPLANGQEGSGSSDPGSEQIDLRFENLDHRLDMLTKSIDDLLWYDKVGDVALIDKVYMYGPPLAREPDSTAMGAGNPVKFWSYIFVPKDINPSNKYPLLVFPHGGVHADFTTYYAHIIRELMAQQYIVVAPEYRGSTGYGSEFYRKIDYGGLETEDADASRAYMLENCEFVDTARVGIIGWSHGGAIALMNVFDHPDHYKVAYAGVPVSDLVERMRYSSQDYRDLFSAGYHLGKIVEEDVEEYQKRSPVWNVDKLNTPLLVHTNTNDEDVSVVEVQHLIKALQEAGKQFEYKVYEELPGGHSFNRMDTRLAREIRLEIYDFLGRYLNPPRKLSTAEELARVSYRF